ncbi:site-specific DNA-methyltransferase [Pseudomonas aeruginosa]|uniref:DNA-methyltransferase n=1 Tax=Pseudomonas aeruginosa TaxID=287 RepID=UPI002E2B61CF|nr:site-specific DNA-methyltransferase [Pseudomonas aeruginosa]
MELPYRLHLQVLKTFPDNSFDSVVTDPPYGLSFMGKRWDYDVPSVEIWAECLRVLKPGGHLLAFAGTRTQHRMALRIEDAGFEIRDIIAWVYGSGFPKSKNLDGDWQGWGTALKPALEPITVARKPLAGTVAANVLAHGTGTLNIDGCRINPTGESRERVGEATQDQRYTDAGGTNFAMKPGPRGGDAAGRWPANLIHDGSIEVVALFPADAGQAAPLATRNSEKTRNSYGAFAGSPDAHFSPHDAGGSAARFFYCAKASRKDRNEGCEHMERKPLHWSSGSQNPGSFQSDGTDKTSQNNHPTVKPTDLMAYLVRLVTPPGGRVLDPFTGSGSTGKAAVREGFEFVGIEREPPYLAIAEARIAHELERVTAAALETAEAEAQLDIFRDAKEQIA